MAPIKIPRCEERKKVRWWEWETRVVHQTLTLIEKKKNELIYLFSTLIRAGVCRQRPLFCLSLLAEQQSTTWLWFSHRSAGERSGPRHPALWHSDYVGTDPSWATHPPLLFPGLAECNTSLTKSHFPFLSNFHTPTTTTPTIPSSPDWRDPWKKEELWWHAHDTFPSPPPLPAFPAALRLSPHELCRHVRLKPFNPDGTLLKEFALLKTCQLWH